MKPMKPMKPMTALIVGTAMLAAVAVAGVGANAWYVRYGYPRVEHEQGMVGDAISEIFETRERTGRFPSESELSDLVRRHHPGVAGPLLTYDRYETLADGFRLVYDSAGLCIEVSPRAGVGISAIPR